VPHLEIASGGQRRHAPGHLQAHGRGATHDFALYKHSQLELHESFELLADSGYQGLRKLHEQSQTPQKKSKKHPLTKAARRANRTLSRRRVVVENVIRSLKIFRILLERYRNRRKRFALRFNLIAGLYNFELSL
jgi:IS5 family transposase